MVTMLLVLIAAALAAPPRVAGLEAPAIEAGVLTPLEARLLALAEIDPAQPHDAVWCIVGAPPTRPSLTWGPNQKATIEQGKWTVRAGAPTPEQLTSAALTDVFFFFAEAGEPGELSGGCRVGGRQEITPLLKRLAATYEEQGKTDEAIQTWRRIAAEQVSTADTIEARLSLVRLHSVDEILLAHDQIRLLQALPLSAPERAQLEEDLTGLLTRQAAQAHIDALRDPSRTAAARGVYASVFTLLPALADGPLGETAAALSP